MTTVEVFAPAKINLTLHVTRRREDGYHELDSLVAFADVGDVLRLSLAARSVLSVTGPMAGGVPDSAGNLAMRAAEAFGVPAEIVLEKRLPAAAGLGGGSADAAAVLRGLAELTGRGFAGDPAALGSDVPVCLEGRAARMSGLGEVVAPIKMPKLDAVVVNPGVPLSTAAVFARLTQVGNRGMGAVPEGLSAPEFCGWLRAQRNDLETPAISLAPAVRAALDLLSSLPGQLLSRMSGSGASCFALFEGPDQALAAAASIARARPGWWVRACRLS